MGEFGDLVGLDVRAKAQAMTVEIGLAAPEIVLHRVEIDHRARRIQVLDKHFYDSFDLLAAAPSQRGWSPPDKGSITKIRQPRITAVMVTRSTAPAIAPR
jgi:hypothetical protein